LTNSHIFPYKYSNSAEFPYFVYLGYEPVEHGFLRDPADGELNGWLPGDIGIVNTDEIPLDVVLDVCPLCES